VYFVVFGAGAFYVLRLMAQPPEAGRVPPPGPQRAAGLLPGLARARPRRGTQPPREGAP